MKWLVAGGDEAISGTVTVPGDKSISHRALMLGALGDGKSTLRGLSNGADVLSTKGCLEQLGVEIYQNGHLLEIAGGSLKRPEGELDAGNSGTTIRLLSGILAGQPFESKITGDDSLRSRPMERIARPLNKMGAVVETTAGRPPLTIHGGGLRGITFEPEVPSAQVKSAVLLAGLFAGGRTTVVEKVKTRDHTERMLRSVGIEVEEVGDGVSVNGADGRISKLHPLNISIPGDFSSAAFWFTLAAVSGGSITVQSVGLNPTRTAFLNVLRRMGIRVEIGEAREQAGEPVGDVTVTGGNLKGTTVAVEESPLLIDELPLVALLGTMADGTTSVAGAAELRAKESDRIASIVGGLTALGADLTEATDGFTVQGPRRLTGSTVSSHGDHRIAMMLALAGSVAEEQTVIEHAECASISYPQFAQSLGIMGVDVAEI